MLLSQFPNTSAIQLGRINITKVAIRSIGHLWTDIRGANVDEEEYVNRCSNRMRSVLRFAKSYAFYLDIAAGALSAIHRWHFARVLESRGADSSSPRLWNALLAFYESTCEIIRGCNAATEHILNRAADPGVYRLTLYGALIREYLYMAEKIVSLACDPLGVIHISALH